MAHVIKKDTKKKICPHCNHLTEFWVIEYSSVGMKSKVTLCSNCEKIIKTENKKIYLRTPDLHYGSFFA